MARTTTQNGRPLKNNTKKQFGAREAWQARKRTGRKQLWDPETQSWRREEPIP